MGFIGIIECFVWVLLGLLSVLRWFYWDFYVFLLVLLGLLCVFVGFYWYYCVFYYYIDIIYNNKLLCTLLLLTDIY